MNTDNLKKIFKPDWRKITLSASLVFVFILIVPILPVHAGTSHKFMTLSELLGFAKAYGWAPLDRSLLIFELSTILVLAILLIWSVIYLWDKKAYKLTPVS